MLAAPDEAGDDLCHAALLALVGVGHQALHVRPQHGHEGVAEVPEQALRKAAAGLRTRVQLPPRYSIPTVVHFIY